MALSSGSRLGSYEVLSLLGRGGMGEVYRARDHKLGREVALKILPQAFGADPDRLARFEQEARTLAALNHPNIATIYGVEDDGETRALVMELVSGETLTERLARASRRGSRSGNVLPLHEALAIARQIADALDAAHARGIVHRDLKPDNVKLTPTGTVKVLDFGLAKVRAPDEQAGPHAATETRLGVVLGTAGYMSPEQARGYPVDRRSDVWAFGCVLYELLTGRPAFDGPTDTDTLAAVLEREPEWERLPAAVPASIVRLLKRCLTKNPQHRLRDIGDIRILVEDVLAAPEPATGGASVSAAPRRSRRSLAVGLAAAAVLALVAGSFAVSSYFDRSAEPEPASAIRLSFPSPGTVQAQIAPAVSPEGRRVAFVSTAADTPAGPGLLWIRDLDGQTPRLLPGTEDARHPFWSPDGRSVGFWARGRLWTVNAAGGPVNPVAGTESSPSGATWSPNGTIVFARATGIAAVPASGGTAEALLEGWIAGSPQFLPDGRHFLFVGTNGREPLGVYVGSLESREAKRVLSSDTKAAYAAPGWLLFLRDETLVAQPFDAESLTLSGEPVAVAEGVFKVRPGNVASFSVNDTGVLVYTNASLWLEQLAVFDRTGRPLGVIGAPALRIRGQTPQFSPDGRRVLVAEAGNWGVDEDVWLHETEGASARLTFDPSSERLGVWSADGRRILFQRSTWGPPTPSKLVVAEVDPAGPELLLAELPAGAQLNDWSADGRHAILTIGSTGPAELWALPLGEGGESFRLVQSSSHIVQSQISPNGRWIAYTSSESGRDEVYAVSFQTPSIKRQLSSNGGVQPRWRRDGGEFFYVGLNQELMSVPIVNQETLQTGPPAPLFRARILAHGSQGRGLFTMYDAAPDGQRFVMNLPPPDQGPAYSVVLNWNAGLRR